MSSLEWVAPSITGVFGIVIGIVGAIMSRRGQKLGSRENRAPDVQEMWAQQEADRRARQTTEDVWWALRSAFRGYYRRVTTLIARMGLSPEQQQAFELTPIEQRAIDGHPPSD